jgi:hypothetical protein
MILDEKGNQLIAKTNENIISLHLKLSSEKSERLLGIVNKVDKTFQINRVREKHLFKRNKSYGFNYFVLKNAKTFDKIYLIDDVTSFMIPVKFVLENGGFLQFQQQGFELQIFLPIEKMQQFEYVKF